ncbi:hypothetical protein MACH09_36280 [Vibrio sp. MACH09]|nr:hypothetical protein MACH09_36280 [Vibrio sp. MACH09]
MIKINIFFRKIDKKFYRARAVVIAWVGEVLMCVTNNYLMSITINIAPKLIMLTYSSEIIFYLVVLDVLLKSQVGWCVNEKQII